MEYRLKWTEENRLGEIILRDFLGEYSVSIPIAVEQISSVDLGCVANENEQNPISTPQSEFIPTLESLTSQRCNNNDFNNCWEIDDSSRTMVWIGDVTSNSYIGQSGNALAKIQNGYSSIVNLSVPMTINICSGSIDNNSFDGACPHVLTISSGTHIIKSPGTSGGYVISPKE